MSSTVRSTIKTRVPSEQQASGIRQTTSINVPGGSSQMHGSRNSTIRSNSGRTPSNRGSAIGGGGGGSTLAGKSRYSAVSRYSNTNITPLNKEIHNVPISTMTATGLAALFYIIPVIMIFSVKCPFTREVIFYFSSLLIALLALATMAGINMIFPRYRFNCLSLSVSLLYSGSAALIILSLVETACYGLCWPNGYSGSNNLPAPMPTTLPTTSLPSTTTSSFANSTVTANSTLSTRSVTLSYNIEEDDYYYNNNENITYLTRKSNLDFYSSQVGLFKSGIVSNYFLWIFAAIGVCFQIVAHYFYG